MTNDMLIVNRVDLRRIETDIEKQKRAARRIPSPLPDMLGRDVLN